MPNYNLSSILFMTILFLGSTLCVTGCNKSDDASKSQALIPVNNESQYIETGDLDALQARGSIRILMPRFSQNNDFLPRRGFPLYNEAERLSEFAKQIGLSPSLIYVEDFNNIIPMLAQGKGDLIAANMTVTDERSKLIDFTSPLELVIEQIIVPADSALQKLDDLVGKRIAVQKSTSFYNAVQALAEKHEGLEMEIVADDKSILSILDGVTDGTFDAAMIDSNMLEAILTYDNQFKVIHSGDKKRAIAWGIRKQAVKLQVALNKFILEQQFVQREYPIYKTDLPGIIKQKKLRVLTRNNAATYFLWKGQLLGFEYELVREFAKQKNLKIEMIVPPSREALYEWLLQGRGDLIAASLTINAELETSGFKFSKAMKNTTEVVVARADDDSINSLSDLAGRSIFVRKNSAYWQSLNRLIESGIALKLMEAPDDLETEDIISKVAQGTYDLTISDSHILDIELTWRKDIKAAFPLGEPIGHGWVVRSEDTQLLEAVNAFINKEYRGMFYNITHRKYFEKPQTIRKRLSQRVDGHGGGLLSPYDDLVKRQVIPYGFDWRLIVSQMYQESQFNPNAKSWAGAKGLMQIMPNTARQLNVTDLVNPEKGIEAGVRYMDWLMQRFEPELLRLDRVLFSLAAYNAGLGHVRDARRLAKQKGWDSNLWFDNVERAILLLSKQEYAKNARYGYVRGSEPVKYVREISNRLKAYLQLTGESKLIL